MQEALKDLLGGTIQEMMEAELDNHLGYESYERSDNPDYRNGTKSKTLRSTVGEIPIAVPKDRDGDFEPKVVPKYKKDISDIESKVISLSAKGLTTRQISSVIEDIYGCEISEGMVSNITDKIMPDIEAWQNRPLSAVYPIVFVDCIHFSVRDEHIVKKLAAYIILGISIDGHKEVLSITVGENESAKFWLSVLNSLKNRGVKDIFVLCADGLSGIKESIATAFPKTEYQRCIVHQVRNTLKYVANKDMKEFAKDLKTIYHAADEKTGYEQMLKVKEKWDAKYPNAMERWVDNWDVISPFFNFPQEIRTIMYTTNIIEGVNRQFRKVTKTKSTFPSDESLLKLLYLASQNIMKKWTTRYKNLDSI